MWILEKWNGNLMRMQIEINKSPKRKYKKLNTKKYRK